MMTHCRVFQLRHISLTFIFIVNFHILDGRTARANPVHFAESQYLNAKTPAFHCVEQSPHSVCVSLINFNQLSCNK